MPSIMQMLDDLVGAAAKHPQAEELLSAIPTVAGAMMLARNGGNTRLGAPLGAGLTALGGMGLFKGNQDAAALAEEQRQKKMSAALKNAFPTMGPQPSVQQALPSLVEGGWSPSESISLAKEIKPEAGDLYWDNANNQWARIPVGSTPSATMRKSPPVERLSSEHEPGLREYMDAHPEMNIDQARKRWTELGRAPDKPRYSLGYKDGKPVRINLDSLEETPVEFTKSAPKAPKVMRVGDVLGYTTLADDGTPTFKKILDIPAKVKDKNEFQTYAEGYLGDHPNAKGPEIVKAYEADKRPLPAIKSPQLPTELKAVYTPSAYASIPGAWILNPAPNAIYPRSGILGMQLGGKPAPPLLFIPGKGFVAPGQVVPGTSLRWDGKP